ncbi:hypothetical protein GCM10010840_16680 [Deinococcus aerolatus]|uniref:Uncharacterized protein n=1 Tax=Deinococcus aerolatus TaxID=522487 RepID=A0ABQ2G7X7_9DEIO|nr:hypothetical protein GCM10010840_16680 [Deinococcus aerolatus]
MGLFLGAAWSDSMRSGNRLTALTAVMVHGAQDTRGNQWAQVAPHCPPVPPDVGGQQFEWQMEYDHGGPDGDTTRPARIQAQREQHAKYGPIGVWAPGAVHAVGQGLDRVKNNTTGTGGSANAARETWTVFSGPSTPGKRARPHDCEQTRSGWSAKGNGEARWLRLWAGFH